MKKLLLMVFLVTMSCLALAQSFVPGNLVISRYGTGTAPLGATPVAVFLDEYKTDGTLVLSRAMPITTNSTNHTKIFSGIAPSNSLVEGLMTLSANKKYLTAFGYNAYPGSTATGATRTVAVITADGNINTTTSVESTSSSARCAVTSDDGTKIWVTANAIGVSYIPLGGSATTPLYAGNGHSVAIFNNQLYFTLFNGNLGAYKVGTGLPTSGTQTLTALPGVPINGTVNIDQFVFFDLNNDGTPDLMYYVDSNGFGTFGKYAFNGTTWVSKGTVSVSTGSPLTKNIRSIAGRMVGTTAELYAVTTFDSANSALLKFTDASAATSTVSAANTAPVLVVNSPTNTIFRAVSFTPVDDATALAVAVSSQTNISASGMADGAVTVAGTGGTAPYQYKLGTGAYQSSGTFSGLAAGTYTVTIMDAASATSTVNFTITQPSLAVSVSSQTNVAVYGASTGSVTVAGANGTAPYQYKLGTGAYQSSGTFSGLAGGTYTVTIMDAASATSTVNFTITQPPGAFSYSPAVAATSFGTAGSSAAPAINNGGLTITYSLSGTVPAGITINTSTGVISYSNAVAVGSYPLTVNAVNTAGSISTSYTVTVNTAVIPVTLPRLVSNGMVLQRNAPIPVWGWGGPGNVVTVAFNGHTYTATVGADTKWQVALPAMAAGGPYTMTVSGTNVITISDILIGDVYLCSGQSNMAYLVSASSTIYGAEIASSANTQIRHFAVNSSFSSTPQTDLTSTAGWQSASPTTVGSFTAVGYFFARDLYAKYGVPIGLINSSWGGTPGEAWISKEGLANFPNYTSQVPTSQPTDPMVLYNGLINPLLNYSIKGVLWYQGESNANTTNARALEYRYLLQALITDWRNKFNQGTIPFLIVQLANYNAQVATPAESLVAEVREGQAMALSMPNTALAVIHETNSTTNLHPLEKKIVGERVSIAAQKLIYGENIVGQGPTFVSKAIVGNKMVVTFANTGTGLSALNGPLTTFAIAGTDNNFVYGTATIVGNTVEITSPAVPNPVSVRYAWADNPGLTGSLYNSEGLPASCFRKDSVVAVDPSFTPDNLVLSRYGDGAAPLSTTGCVPVFLDEYTTAGSLVKTRAMPVTTNGANQLKLFTGLAPTASAVEGLLTLSSNKKYLTAFGYHQAPGSSSSLVPRTVAVIAADGIINTTTAVEGTSSSARCAVASDDGKGIWVTANALGVSYIPFGGSASTPLYTGSGNSVSVFNNQLYFSLYNGNLGAYKVGTGLPTSGTQTLTALPGVLANASLNISQFIFFDLDNNGTPDLMYYVNSNGNGSLGKYSFNGTTWVSKGTVTMVAPASPLTKNIRSLAGRMVGTTAEIYAVTVLDNTASALIKFTDASAATSTISATSTAPVLVSNSPVNTIFRSVSFTPVADASTALAVSLSAQTNVIAYGASTGSATVAGTGGTAPYQYKIGTGAYQSSSTFSNLAAGTYTITIGDANSATATVNVTITQPASALAVTVGSQTNVTVNGASTGSVTVTGAGGTTPYQYKIGTGTYQSSGTFSGLAAGNYTVTISDANAVTSTVDFTITQPAAALSVAVSSQTNVTVYGASTGSVTVTGTNGTAPYQYKIGTGDYQSSSTFSGLAAGAYTITVSDANLATATVNFTITQPAGALAVAVNSQTNVFAYGASTGAVTVTGTGGTAPYQYQLGTGAYQGSSTFSGLAAGAYTITISDASSATATVNFTITQPTAALALAINSQTNVIAYGASTGAVTVTGTGGTAPYQYQLGTGAYQSGSTFSSLAAGTYILTVKDANGITATVNAIITQPASALAVTVGSKTNVFVNGAATGAVTVAGAGGTAPYQYKIGTGAYQSSGTFNGLAAGTYTITVSDANAITATVSVTITQPSALLAVNVVSKTNALANGVFNGAVTVSGAGGTLPYQYKLNDGAYQSSGTFSGIAAATYTITVIDANGVTATVSVTITQPSNNAALTGLTLNHGALSPAFAPDIANYSASVDNSVSAVTVSPVSADANAAVTVNGMLTGNGSASGSIALNVGNNTITIVITAQDGIARQVYTIIINRPDAPDAAIATNILSPNGDGRNDMWVIKDILSYPNNTVTVFDRAGRTIYTKKGYTNDWGGTLQGAPLTEGTYYYLIDLGPGERKVKGFISIVRDK